MPSFCSALTEMNRHLTSIAGSRMKSIMMTLTKGPVRGYMTGLGITIVNQSSSATTVLEVALVGAGLMTFQQSLAVTLGAELGSTFLPQLVAFPSITKFSTLFVFTGFITRISAKSKRGHHIGMTIFTFGLLFLGMDMMSTSLKPLRNYEPFIRLMRGTEAPVLGILMGMVFTMIIQSSGATTSITIAMAMAGTISLEQAVPINLGAAIGTCITAVLGSLTLNREAKRSAYIHILFQLIGALWVVILLYIPFHGERLYIWWLKWFTINVLRTDSLARQIAMGFTFMPVINHFIVFPGLKPILAFFNRIFPEKESETPFGPAYINEGLIETGVELSLLMTRKEILRVSDLVHQMIREMRIGLESDEPSQSEKISELDNKVDVLHKRIITFLAELSQEEMSPRESKLCIKYMYIQNELESIGDIIDKNIMALARKKIDQNLVFSEEGFNEIEDLIYLVNRNFATLAQAMRSDDAKLAKSILDTHSHKKKIEEKFKKLHMERLAAGKEESLATSSIHLDLISYFSRINGQIAYIAKRLI